MSLRPSPWVFGVGGSRRASQQAAVREPARVPRPDLRVLEGGAKSQNESRLARVRLIASVSLICLVLFGVVAFHVVLSQGQFQLENMQTKATQEQAQYERLRLQVAQLEAPSRITGVATERLGMVPADKVTAIAPHSEDVSPAQNSFQKSGGNPTNDPSRAEAWAKVKPQLSPATK